MRCPACGYDLTGVTLPACPECGLERGTVESILPLCGRLGLHLSLAVWTVFWLLAIRQWVIKGFVFELRELLWVLGFPLVIAAAYLFFRRLWAHFSADIDRHPARKAWALVLLCWTPVLLPAAAIAVLLLLAPFLAPFGSP